LIPWDRQQGRTSMPIILWLLGVPLIVVIALMITHVI
jgi:hypothetical protein